MFYVLVDTSVWLAIAENAMQRLRSFGRDRRVHGVGHIETIEPEGMMLCDRPDLEALLTVRASLGGAQRLD